MRSEDRREEVIAKDRLIRHDYNETYAWSECMLCAAMGGPGDSWSDLRHEIDCPLHEPPAPEGETK